MSHLHFSRNSVNYLKTTYEGFLQRPQHLQGIAGGAICTPFLVAVPISLCKILGNVFSNKLILDLSKWEFLSRLETELVQFSCTLGFICIRLFSLNELEGQVLRVNILINSLIKIYIVIFVFYLIYHIWHICRVKLNSTFDNNDLCKQVSGLYNKVTNVILKSIKLQIDAKI